MTAALKRAGVPLNRQARFAECGASCHAWYSINDGSTKLVAAYCRDRFCIPCGTARGALVADNLLKLVTPGRDRFITLTKRSFGDSLTTTLDALIASFSRLRQSFFWKSHVKGGAAMIEVKRGKGSGNWHCHLHILSHGRYLDQKELSREWQKASGDSFIVDVRAIRDAKGLAGYVTKYVAKPLDPSVFMDPADLVECVLALRGRRLCNTFGDWRGVELESRSDDPGGWREIGPIDSIIADAEGGDDAARQLFNFLRGVTHEVPTSEAKDTS